MGLSLYWYEVLIEKLSCFRPVFTLPSNGCHCVHKMPKKSLHIRISERRLNKLREYAVSRDKTMTSIIEDLIDSLPDNTLPEIHLNANSTNMAWKKVKFTPYKA